MKTIKSHLGLILTGYFQVFFVAVNTYFLAKENYAGVVIASFMISLIWTLNVKKVAFGSWIDRIVYATAAMVGSLTGLYFSSLINELL